MAGGNYAIHQEDDRWHAFFAGWERASRKIGTGKTLAAKKVAAKHFAAHYVKLPKISIPGVNLSARGARRGLNRALLLRTTLRPLREHTRALRIDSSADDAGRDRQR